MAFARAQVETELNTAIKNGQILENAWGVLGIELMAAAQALELDFREFTPGRGVQAARRVVRKYVDHLEVDRPLYPDHTRMQELVRSCEVLEEVRRRSAPWVNLPALSPPRPGHARSQFPSL